VSVDPLHDLTDRLEQTAARLRAGELEPEQAARLVEDCARLAGEAATELDRRVRAAADAPAREPRTPDAGAERIPGIEGELLAP
jgi:hypothetical protein